MKQFLAEGVKYGNVSLLVSARIKAKAKKLGLD